MAQNTQSTMADGATYRANGCPEPEPCRFPRFGKLAVSDSRPMSTRVQLESLRELHKLLSAAGGAELPALVCSAWALLLRCYTGQDDVCFGVDAAAPRTGLGDSQATPGVAPSMTVARVVLNDSMSLAQLVQQFKHRSKYEEHPLFDTAVVLRDAANKPASTTGIALPSLKTLSKKHKICLLVKNVCGSVSMFMEWCSSHISAAQGSLIASTLDRIISEILLSPHVTISDLSSFSQRNFEQICKWNSIPFNKVERCIPEVFQDRVLARPSAEAVCSWDGNFTYMDLSNWSDKLARRLVGVGVGPECLVPLCFDKSKWNIVAMLGVMKAGGAFVPLDPSHPVERLQTLCHSVGATTLLCSRNHARHLETLPLNIIPVDAEAFVDVGSEDALVHCGATNTNAAYVIFTSGSTGEPKGTVIEHSAYCSSAAAHAPALRISEDSRVLQFAAHTFDASLVETLTPLMVGACVCIPNEVERLNDIVGVINRMHINHAVLTPSFIGFVDPSEVPGLRDLVLAGEAMSQSHVNTWSKINLVNGYGPAESAVTAAINSAVTPDTDPKDIGLPVGLRCWVVDPSDHDRLVPVGCVGELLLEGPNLAREYLNNPTKTRESFIPSPTWAQSQPQFPGPRRFYKTGDLVRYHADDGSFRYVGRKDTQIKFHGQRIELGEIEHHLNLASKVKYGLVLLPKTGPFAQKLLAIICLKANDPPDADSADGALHLLDSPGIEADVEDTRSQLSSRLPAYMVPSTWICLQDIPMLPSRKLDRKTVARWVENMPTELFHKITGRDTLLQDELSPATEDENKLRTVVSHVLNIPLPHTLLDRSFLHLGGDSITAMTCMNQAKRVGLGLTVQDILRSQSLRHLASLTKPVEHLAVHKEMVGVPFELSPIQQLHFRTRVEGEGHFNQSFFLRISRHTYEHTIQEAVDIIVRRHAMLRARFRQRDSDNEWEQYITDDISSSRRFRSHKHMSSKQVKEAIASAQCSLDAVNGPLFAVELCETTTGEQLLFMVGHHLVIDLVSWRVILEDLEEAVENPEGNELATTSLPFQTWCLLQIDDAKRQSLEKVLPGGDVPAADFSYWGVSQEQNIYGEVACEGFEIDSLITSTLLTDCHKALNTETVDLLLACLLFSFGRTFIDRGTAVVFTEGHGREPPQQDIDISRTVGWFTTVYPICVPAEDTHDLVDVLVRVKDLRRRVPANGRPYFASRFHSANGREKWAHHSPMEISFNYLGQYQQLEREGALLQAAEAMAGEARVGSDDADFSYNTPRFGLFEISAVIVQGKIRFSFTFNRHMQHQDGIRKWISSCRQALIDASHGLLALKPRRTLSDFPLLDLPSNAFKSLETEKLPSVGVSHLDQVEDIYPCSPMQQGLLLSQTKDAAYYAVVRTFEVKSKGGETVDAERVLESWRQVVNHHAALRSVFIDSLGTEGTFDQVVLRSPPVCIVFEKCHSDEALHRTSEEKSTNYYGENTPPHRFSIFHSASGRVFCKLEMSHAIMDGGSMSIILRDLTMAYAGRLQQKPKPLYSNFVAYLKTLDVASSIEFWKTYLADSEPCHFPVLSEGAMQPKQLHSLRLRFDGVPQLQDFCDRNGFTLANALHVAWALTLRCYVGSEDVCFGYLVSGRNPQIVGSEDAVGPFINMATCRVKFAENVPFLQILDQVQKDYIESLPYCQASLAEVQHGLKLAGVALFNTCISFRKLPSSSEAQFAPIALEDIGPIHDPTEYPVSVNVELSEEEAAIDLDYWTDSISSVHATHIGNTFLQALTNIIENSQLQISEIDHVSSDTKQQIWSWNSKMPPTIEKCVHWVFEDQVKIQPHAPAICAWDSKHTYSELDDLTERLADYLVEFGVGPEVLVPICFDKSAWTVIAMLAVMKAGGGCVPLDATHPQNALEHRVFECSAHVVLASEQRAHIFEDMVPYVVAVGPALLYQLPKHEERIRDSAKPLNPAFVIFTSGSTGKPKGVILEHRALVTSAYAHGSALGLSSQTRFLQFATYTFDNSIEEMFTTLIHGGCICVPSEEDRFNNLAKAINDLDANFMDLTPTVAAFLRPVDVPKIRAMAVGGEALTKEAADIWADAIPMHNQYGPSECSINAAHYLVPPAPREVSNIGWSVGSVSWIVHPSNHNFLVPVGCTGELLIEGPILARGYLNDEEKTAKSFISNPAWAAADPCGAKSGDRRMYKTGDLVRYNSDGSLSYLGRKDTQVKLNGQRIELGEIEHHVKCGLPTDAQSAVELVEIKGSARKALAAFIYLPETKDAHREEQRSQVLEMSNRFQNMARSLEEYVAKNIASYMVPSIYIPVSYMPLTSSGKLDRRALRDMGQGLSEERAKNYRLGGRSGRSPSTEAELAVQRLWAEVLKVNPDSISADDSFFSHGGDSIGAMRLVAAAKKEGVNLTVASIFQTPKLSELALAASIPSGLLPDSDEIIPLEPFALVKAVPYLEELKRDLAAICHIETNEIEDIYPCTTVQEGLVAISNKQPGAYVAMNSYELPPDIDISRFQRAWEEVAAAEVILRTRVAFVDSMGFLQVVVKGSIAWEYAPTVDAIPSTNRHLPPHDGGILARFTIVGREKSQPYFIWTVHHALYDGWSLSVLLDRVEDRYRNMGQLQQPSPQFSRFIEYLGKIDSKASDSFWASSLSETASPQFPHLPSPTYEVQARSQTSHSVKISKPQDIDLTVASMLRAAWALVVSSYSSSDDVVFGEILTGRDVPVPKVEDMAAPTLCSIPRRIVIQRDDTVHHFLQNVQKQLVTVIPHQFSGLQRIKRLGSTVASACDFQNLLAINQDDGSQSTGFWKLKSSGTVGSNFFSYALNVSCTITGENLDIEVNFDENIIPKWHVARLLCQLETILARLSSKDSRQTKVGEINILSSWDEKTLFEWNRAPLEYVEKSVQEVIGEQVLERGDTTSILSWDATFSYREVDHHSTLLAQKLSNMGIGGGLGGFVPICFEKSAYAVIAMLAIMKAGAAFVPLDPAYPVARLREIVDDVDAKLILSSNVHKDICHAVVAKVLAVDMPMLEELPTNLPSLRPVHPKSPAYVIFTSGTTGKPKGTIIQHSALCSGGRAHASAMHMKPPFRFLQFASYTFDASIVETLTTLMFGGTTCIPSEHDRLNNIAATMEKMEVSMTLLTPSFAQTIQPSEVPHLRTLILGGEAMSQVHISTWADKVHLVNAYGPSECSVVATVNSEVTSASHPANIGQRLDRCWIVDPNNHHRLAPIGSVGELMIEGPTLSAGYLNNEAKTAESFIENPGWCSGMLQYGDSPPVRRMYKTGDLVRICSDVTGEMMYVGRKDTQAKLNGQRLELDEIYHHINEDSAVQHVVVALPKAGAYARRLVAVLSLKEPIPKKSRTNELEPITTKETAEVTSQIQSRIKTRIPPYMVPTQWVVLQELPLLPSGKLDRRRVVSYLENLSEKISDSSSKAESLGARSRPLVDLSKIEKIMTIICQTLDIPREKLNANESFLQLGGDSISAMRVMAKCRSEGIKLTVQEIIRSSTIMELVSLASFPEQVIYNGEDNHEFDLSPIQQLYFKVVDRNIKQFNQSVLLRVTTQPNASDVIRAINAVVKAHSMLRSRFRKDGNEIWRQRVTTEIQESFRFKNHNLSNASRMKTRIEDSQKALDIVKGPILAADLFKIRDGDSVLFIAIHHLAVDVVSWGVILQDLEDFLTSGLIKSPASMPFQTWSRSQSEQAIQQNGELLLPYQTTYRADFGYWDMENVPNLHGDVVTRDLEFDQEVTASLTGPCHKPLQTDILDIMLAVLLHSYQNTFSDRDDAPTIFNEGHGREPWDGKMDVSRTVGWFTTLCPVALPKESAPDDDLIEILKWVKDYRRRLPGNGRCYFARRLLTSEGRDEYGNHWPMELAFNYLGQIDQMTNKDSILQPVEHAQSVNFASDIGNAVPRFSLIEISAAISGGRLTLSFSYNRHMKHQDKIQDWIKATQDMLTHAPKKLLREEAKQTLADFPLLPLVYRSSNELAQTIHSLQNINHAVVEDIYPCSPMQRGLLLSQMKDSEKYAYEILFEIVTADQANTVDLMRLESAWQSVLNRHTSLRTVFIDSISGYGLMDQAVLAGVRGRTDFLENVDSVNSLSSLKPFSGEENALPHRLILCKTNTGQVFCKLEISHAISDGSSIPILLDDLMQAYSTNPASSITVSRYSDYISYLQSQSRELSSDYWRNYLENVEPCLFPRLNDGVTTTNDSLRTHILKIPSISSINSFCSSAGITLSNLFQLTWALVLRSYIGSDEICFGYLTSGRDLPIKNIEQAVGAFINMLVCRLGLPEDMELGEALDRIQTDFTSAMAYQNCSLAEVQHELNLSGASLFNTAFTYQKRALQPEKASSEISYKVIESHDPSEYDIAVNVEVTESSIEVHLSYWASFLSESQAKNIADAFNQIIEDIVEKPLGDRTLGDLNLFALSACQQIYRWNKSELPRIDKCIHEIIEENARLASPSTPAICGWDGDFTYAELNAISTRLANHLMAQGVKSEIYVPLCFEKSAWTIIAQVAILKAGGAFVNLEPTHPEARLRHLVEDVGASLVLCSAKYETKAKKICRNAITINRVTISQLPDYEISVLPREIKSSDPAYVIFTSGTTGMPKGTVLEHGAFCTGAIAHGKAMLMNSASRVLQFASYTFDASVMEIFTTLLLGGCVCVPSEQERLGDIPGVIRKMDVTWTLLTPSVAGTLRPESIPSLKVLVTGGEAMSAGHIARWKDRCALVNAYGPTETSVVATVGVKVDETHTVVNDDRFNIGHAVGGRVWVVDHRNPDRLVPLGAVGELVVEGRLVARGYLNNEKKTSEVFISNPGWTSDLASRGFSYKHERMYRTGDLVRFNSDGSVSYVSRKDTQIKLNGQRIELGEIEHQCRMHLPPDAQAGVELVLTDTRVAAKKLAVFFSIPSETPSHEASTSNDTFLLPMSEPLNAIARNLEKSLTSVLPAYMVPQLFVPVAKMPWMSSGKLDRRTLRQSVEGLSRETVASYRLAVSGSQRKPTTKMESALQALWESALKLPPGSVGAEDNFFKLGGDSLTAMNIAGNARSQNILLPVRVIFSSPKLCDMAKACESLKQKPKKLEADPFSIIQKDHVVNEILQAVQDECELKKEDIQDIYPCSSLQEGLVTLANTRNGAYVARNVFRLPNDLNIDLFKAAWESVVDETDSLRTRIVHLPGSGFFQVVAKKQPIAWRSAINLREASTLGNRIPEQQGGPLTEYILVGDDEGNDRYFIWVIHHALYDGWSLPLVLHKVESTYFKRSTGGPATPYSHFIKYVLERDVEQCKNFWGDQLAGASALTHYPQQPSSVSGEAQPKFHSISQTINVTPREKSSQITMPTLIRAAWAIVLSAYTGMDDVVFGETLSGRDIDLDGILEIVGPTFTTVPTRVRIRRNLKLHDFLQAIQRASVEVVPYQHFGLQYIKRINEDTSCACDFQNLLIIQAKEQSEESSIWNSYSSTAAEAFFTHPLVMECRAGEASLETNIYYNQNILPSWNAERLFGQFEAVLQQLSSAIKDDASLISDVNVLGTYDRQMIARWNHGALTSIDACIHELFAERTALHPNFPAISSWDGDLSYQELYEYAFNLAIHLETLGVGPGTLVPVCIERSTWMVVTLIAILLTGGAFVPLDPSHPVARQREILEEIEARLIICSPSLIQRFTGIVQSPFAISGDLIRGLPKMSSPSQLASAASFTSTAYVIFTSGSTGRPKGVVVPHNAFCSSSYAYARAMLMESKSRVFHFASLTFDVGVMEVLSTLIEGACVCIPSEDERLKGISGAMCRMNVTWSFLTPSVANIIEPSSVPTLKTLVCGGEAMVSENVARWADRVTLVNGYGPTETSVIVVVNPRLSVERDPTIIGRGTSAVHTWIVDPHDHNKLTPLGAIGELAISGPILAKEYLKNPSKTAEVFVESPAWAAAFAAEPKRMYKTGDLVRYTPSGTLEFLGRKDNQVKMNGQRMELGEIENRMIADPLVRHALVLLPKSGPCRKKLVAVLSLNDVVGEGPALSANDCELVNGAEHLSKVKKQLNEVIVHISGALPHYMVPQMWAVIWSVPMVVSGKLDRTKVARWLETLSESEWDHINSILVEDATATDQDAVIDILQGIWAKELNLRKEQVKLNRPFLSLGGDSITAMAIMSRCRKEKINLSLQDILRCKSLYALATMVKATGGAAQSQEVVGETFELSPIQKMYLYSSANQVGDARFNQSFATKLPRHVHPSAIRRVLDAIVEHHSMLRARFHKNNRSIWNQMIAAMGPSAYRYRMHFLDSSAQMETAMADSQNCFDIENGPVFAADIFDIENEGQTVFLVAHHLVVDVVSWRIILQDLQELVEGRSLPTEKPLSFQQWCSLHKAHTAKLGANHGLPFKELRPDLAYWGEQEQPDTYGHAQAISFLIDETTTRMFLENSNRAFQTEPVELCLAAIIHSFSKVFSDRDIAVIHCETHGRESAWDNSIDLSRTVGWFTSIYPLLISCDSDFDTRDDILSVVKKTKDTRRSIPENGRQYFAHQFMNHQSMESTSREILFNYLGRTEDPEIDTGTSQVGDLQIQQDVTTAASDVGPDTKRLALFEITAVVLNGKLKLTFICNRNSRRSHQITQWIEQCRVTLQEMLERLKHTSPEPTLSDYPLMSITYDALRTIARSRLPRIGIHDISEVEDIYPCSPTQEGIMISRLRDQGAYLTHAIIEVKSNRKLHYSVQDISKAWQKVVDRHSALRTVFINSTSTNAVFDQVVVRSIDSGAVCFECDDNDVTARLREVSIRDHNLKRLPPLQHQLTVCKTSSGRIFLKIEINNAVVDGGSFEILAMDLKASIEGKLGDRPAPPYSNYIGYILSQPLSADTRFWKSRLSGLQPCHFPQASSNDVSARTLREVYAKFDRFSELQKLSRTKGITIASVIHAAWALVLQKYVGTNDVCFGYLTSGRDVPVEDIQHTVGAFINIVCCRVNISPSTSLLDLVQLIQNEHLESLPFQRCSLAQVQHDLGMTGKSLFNTSLSLQNNYKSKSKPDEAIWFEIESGEDPSEYALTVNIETAKDEEAILLRYRSHIVTDEVASEVARSLVQILDAFVGPSMENTTAAEILSKGSKRSTNRPRLSRLAVPSATIQQEPTMDKPSLATQIRRPQLSRQSTQRSQPEIRISAERMIQPASQFPDFYVQDNRDFLKDVIKECVQQTIEQLLRSGVLQATNPNALGAALSQHLPGAEASSLTNNATTENGQSEAGLLQTVETRPRRSSMAAQIHKRGRSAQTEKKLLGVWSSILGLPEEEIDVHDSFFELGGDSITAMKLVGAARDEGLTLAVADVFQHPSFEDMAAIIRVASMMTTYIDKEDIQDHESSDKTVSNSEGNDLYERFSLIKTSNVDAFLRTNISPQVGIFKGGIADVLPATDFQSLAITGALLESRWMLNYFYLEGRGSLDLRQLKQSCYRLVQAFDILRTVFVPSGDRFLQVILRKLRPEFQVFEIDETFDEFNATLQQRDRDQGPRVGESFVQFTVAKERGSDRHRIFIRLSHAQYDGVCFPKIMSSLQAAYQGETLQPGPSFANYLRASAGTLSSDHYQHWKALLRGSSMTEIVRRKGPNYRRSTGATTHLKKTIQIPALKNSGITTATIIKAAWAYVLAELSAASDVVFGHTISGRNALVPGVGDIIGPCLNLVPVRVQFEPGWKVLDLLRHVQSQQIENMPYEVLGFREIIKHCTDWPDWANFTTTVQHQNIDRGGEVKLGNINYQLGAIAVDEDFSDFSVLSQPLEEPDMVEIVLSYSTNSVIPQQFAEKALDLLCTYAHSFSHDPHAHIRSPLELSQLPRQTIEEPVRTNAEVLQSTHFGKISQAELLVYSDVISNAWRQVLPKGDGEYSTLHLDTSFFELDGDIVGLAQLTWLLERDGFSVRLEDLIDYPTMLGHMGVLYSQNSTGATKVTDLQSASPLSTPGLSSSLPALAEQTPIPLQKTARMNTFVKAVSLARKIVKKNTRPTAPATPATPL